MLGGSELCFLEKILYDLKFLLITGHPNCSHSKTFVLNRYIDEDGRLVTKRLHVIQQRLPSFIQRISGNIVTYGGEESVIDPRNKTVIIHTKNLSFTNEASVLDVGSYYVNPEDPSKTDYIKTTITYGKTLGVVNGQIERWYAYNEGRHFKKGIHVIDDFLSGHIVVDYGVEKSDASVV